MKAGELVAGYRLDSALGKGAQGEVWMATPVDGSAPVALKFVLGLSGDEWVSLADEFQTLQRIDHPHVVRVDAFFALRGNDVSVLAMELLAGGSLSLRGIEGRPLGERLRLMAGVASGLAALHATGLVHRDVKPDNILLDSRGQPKVSDVGIAWYQDRFSQATQDGHTKGTALYMCRGQWAGDPPKQAWDVFSWGLILSQVLGLNVFAHVPKQRLPVLGGGTLQLPGLGGFGDMFSPELRFLEPIAHLGGLAPLLERCLSEADEVRPTAQEAFEVLDELATEHGAPRPVDVGETDDSIEIIPVPHPPGPRPPGPTAPHGAVSVTRRRAWPLRSIAVGTLLVAIGAFVPGLAAHAERRAVLAELRQAPQAALPAIAAALGSETGYSDERPARVAPIPAFSIDRHEVSVASFRRWCDAFAGGCADVSRSLLDPARDALPASGMTWWEASAFCATRGARLPSEDEWERAARGGEGRRWPWGDEEPTCETARIEGCGAGPGAVGERSAGDSADSVTDLAGNVAEWTSDPYRPLRGRAGVDQVLTMEAKVTRGGSYSSDGFDVRGAARADEEPRARRPDLGFRCAGGGA